MQTKLPDFTAGLQQATTLDGLQTVILGLREFLDVEHVVYHSVNSTGQQYGVLTYSPDWVDHYLAEDFARIDPVVQGCFRRFDPVNWKNLDWSGRTTRAFFAEAMDAGVGNQGFSVPIRGPNGQFALFTVSHRATDGAWEKFTTAQVSDLILIAHFVNQKALEIEGGRDHEAMHSLSPREIDVLSMLAMGLNRAQAADSLAISEHTFRTYVESARFKLGANNTTQAVARAVAEGFVII
jgi:DNA-binding CsgD family transcriptional regulator